ncbi:MAG TPA: glycine cleavage system aminomethyltransferase GcvT [Actinomycetota bacterium]
MEQALQHTPLEEEHRALGAALAPFGGWLMPIEYEGVLKEHAAVRERVGIFDLTHLGKVEVRGPRVLRHLQRILTNDLSKVAVGEARYTLVLTERGGIVDDLIAYRTAEEEWMIVPNAGNTARVLGILEDGDADVRHRPDLVTLAVQGPEAIGLVAPSFPEVEGLSFMEVAASSFEGTEVLVARTGYTGEPGVELFVPEDAGTALWRRLLERGATPVGLGARDTLRLEMGYPLHGNDISEDRTPLEAGLSWAVAMDKGDFTGREALARIKEEGGPSERLRGLRMLGRRIPRPHFPVSKDGRPVGETTSGTFSPTLRVGIAMAYLDRGVEPGDTVEVDVRGKGAEAEVVRPPFVDRSPKA